VTTYLFIRDWIQRPATCFFFSSSFNSQPNTFHFILIQLFAYPLGIIHVLPYFKCKLTDTVFIAICHLVLLQYYCLEIDLIQPFICILPEIYCMLCLLQVKSHRLLYKICCSIYTNSDMYDICRFQARSSPYEILSLLNNHLKIVGRLK